MTAPGGSGARDRLSCTAELRRFGVWRSAVATASLLAMAAVAAWAIGSVDLVEPPVLALVVVAALGIVALAASLMRVDAGTLRSDRGAWSFTPARPQAAAESGELAVALDLGGFMLLSLKSPGRPRRWLPAQRRGLEAEWHALRVAVHAPRLPRSDAGPASPAAAAE